MQIVQLLEDGPRVDRCRLAGARPRRSFAV